MRWHAAVTGAAGLVQRVRWAAVAGDGVRQFAEYQPFTPVIESLRRLLAGTPSAGYAIAALAWCAGIGIVGYLLAASTFRKRA